jgi:hypothetical protein
MANSNHRSTQEKSEKTATRLTMRHQESDRHMMAAGSFETETPAPQAVSANGNDQKHFRAGGNPSDPDGILLIRAASF